MYNDREYENSATTKATIIGRNRDECLDKLFEKYGKNYKVLGIKPVLKGGFLGFGQKEYVEVSYLLSNTFSEVKKTQDDFEKNKEELLKQFNPSAKQITALDKKLDAISSMLESKLSDINLNQESLHKNILKIEELLEENEFSREYIKEMENKIRSEFSLEELDDFEKLERQVVDWIGESINICKEKAHRIPHVIVIIGPTGVGKTTTIAKIAAQRIIKANKENMERPSIRLISADVTRVAAEEQLRHYGDALEVQVDKAEKADDIKKIYRECKESTDIILIDTSGYSPNDAENIGRLKQNLSVDGLRPDIYLAVTASTKPRDLRNIIQNYEPFAFNSVIITKCDETGQYGNIISVLAEKHKSISYITYGQAAARDISHASVVEFLKRLNGFNIDRIHIEDKFGE